MAWCVHHGTTDLPGLIQRKRFIAKFERRSGRPAQCGQGFARPEKGQELQKPGSFPANLAKLEEQGLLEAYILLAIPDRIFVISPLTGETIPISCVATYGYLLTGGG